MVGRQNADIASTPPLREVTVATLFGFQLRYNFSCMIGRSLWIRLCVLQNCFRRATVRLGIDTLIADILVKSFLRSSRESTVNFIWVG